MPWCITARANYRYGLHSAHAMHLCRATTALNIVNRFFFICIMEMGRSLWQKTECVYIIWTNRRLVASLSPRWPGFDPSQSNCNWTQWHRDTLFSQYFGLPLSVSFHHCSILIVIFKLLLSEGQEGEDWKPWNKAIVLGTLERTGQQCHSTLRCK